MVHKYQFYISFNDKLQTAASKAILDCKSILAGSGYRDFTLYTTLSSKKTYIADIFKSIARLFFVIKPNSIVAIQYPLLSGNRLFKYFIKALRIKRVRFFCVVHDLDELRYNEHSNIEHSSEAENLCCYDCIIVHNEQMQQWLLDRKVTKPIILLRLFDYLSNKNGIYTGLHAKSENYNTVVFAGNLAKSQFIYSLGALKNWHFNLYGPDFSRGKGQSIDNLTWHGAFNPDDILTKLDGDFGLIWDGDYIDLLDGKHGNYLKYNNPHKLSLYIAAALPVIVPKSSAISSFVKNNNIGILVDSLLELNDLKIGDHYYNLLKGNVLKMSDNVKSGNFFKAAIAETEFFLENIKQ